MLPISGLARLSFASHLEYRAFAESNTKLLAQIWLWHETLGNRPDAFQLHGVCDLCESQTTFAAIPEPKANHGEGQGEFKFRVNWWSGAACKCGMCNLDRTVLRVFLENYTPPDPVYHVGHYSRFRRWLSERIRNLTSSQYQENRTPGEIQDGVRYEDLTKLSFDDGEFSSVICMEVLEHIPDYKAALREMARVLAPRGRAYLSFPWLGRDTYEHLVRAEIASDGTINHILPPEFHGDPAKPGGILSFRSFGWRILEELRESGFSSARAEFVFAPLYGHMTLLTPIIVAQR